MTRDRSRFTPFRTLTDALRRLLPVLLLALPLAGNAYPDTESQRPAKLPTLELTGQVIYQLLIAEIAAHRGNMPVAAAAYMDLARATRDPRIAKRAAEMALYARQPDNAMELARLWTEIEPESVQAKQTLVGLLLAAKRLDEATAQLGKMLALQGEHLGESLPQLNRLLARYPDKAAAANIVAQVTQPYEALPEAHLARAQAYLAADDGVQALAAIDAMQRLQPASEQAVLLKAQILQRSSSNQAQSALRSYLDAYPKARDVRIAYARALVGDRQYAAARREYQALLEADQNDRDAAYATALLSLQLNELAAAEREFKRLLAAGFSEGNTVRLYLGQIAEDSQRPEEALQWYGSVAPGEQYLAARARAATLLVKQGKLAAGRELLQQAAVASVKDAASFAVAEAQLLAEAGQVGEAFDLLDRQLLAQPEDSQLLYESALLAEKLGRYETLETRLRLLMRLKPDHAQAYNALGYSLAERNQRLEEAQQLIEKALALAPDDAFILDSKGWVLYRRGDNSGALDFLQKAYGQRPDPEIAAHLGEVLWMLGRRTDAEKTWDAARQADPRNAVLAATIKKFKP